jgi:SPP1 family predicted phage head-tail adaptor
MAIKPLDIGKLNKRVTFRAPAPGSDAIGQTTQKYKDYATVWATVKALRGGEYYEAQKVRPEKTYKVTVRYIKGLTDGISEDMRIAYAGKTLEIEYINNVDEADYMLEIHATEYIEKTTGDEQDGEDDE